MIILFCLFLNFNSFTGLGAYKSSTKLLRKNIKFTVNLWLAADVMIFYVNISIKSLPWNVLKDFGFVIRKKALSRNFTF